MDATSRVGSEDSELRAAAVAAVVLDPVVVPDGREAPVQQRSAIIFGVASIALFMSSVDQTIVATALPSIQHNLHTGLNWAGWTITAYSLGLVVGMPVAGKMSDLFGRKSIFLGAGITFTLASLCCGLSENIYLLIALRGVQALAGGAFMPSATGIVADQFGNDRDRAVAMFTSILPIGGIVGPVLGGIFVSYWSWRGIFLINVPIGIVLVALTIRFVPASTRATRSTRLDTVGVALLGAMILSIMLGFAFLGSGTTAVSSPAFVGPELSGLVLVTLFLRHIRTSPEPLVPMALLLGRGFGIMNSINFIYGSAALGLPALVPLYAEQRYGISVLRASTLLTARAVGMIAVAGISSMALRRTGVRKPMTLGFVLISLGLVLMAYRPASISPYTWLAITAGITGLGMGSAVPASNNASLQLAPDQVAAIAGLRGMFRQSGAILALSASTALLSRSSNPGQMEAMIFSVFAAILLLTIPMTVLVPDHRGRW